MSRPEWLRTFVAVYRTGSVTEGARSRHLSQPAASQQLAGLERAVGAPLFVRTPGGVSPTRHGVELYGSISEPLDQLEGVLRALDGGVVTLPDSPLRIGSSAECLAGVVLPQLRGFDAPIHASIGDDARLFAALGAGEIDVAITSSPAPKRLATSSPIGSKAFVLVAAPALAPTKRFRSLTTLADWLVAQPWVSYSVELPLTRRLWHEVFGRPFAADLRLVAPDLRVVAEAVEQGMGVSLLPTFVCAGALAAGRLVEVHPVSDLVAPEPWFASVRHADVGREHIRELLQRFQTVEDSYART